MDTSSGSSLPQPPQATAAAAAPGMSRGGKIALWVGLAIVIFTLCACGALVVSLVPETAIAPSGSVALIHVDGVIAGTGSPYDGIVTPESFIDELDQALADQGVEAILLRIDSPGGTVAASQEISLAVRRAAEIKPVVASIGDIGASGAYMVAAQCDHIVAAPGSSVGSIGVIMQIPNASGLLEKLGVEFTVLTEGEYKDAGSPFRSITQTETAQFQSEIRTAYEQFIADVAEGRGMPVPEVTELATGQVWMGSNALDLGLVDSLGNYSDAVDKAAELAGIEGEPNIVEYGYEDPFEALFSSLIGFASPASAPDAETLRRLGLPR